MKSARLSTLTGLVGLLGFGSGCSEDVPQDSLLLECVPPLGDVSLEECVPPLGDVSLEQTLAFYSYEAYVCPDTPTPTPRKGELAPVGGNLKYSLIAVPDEGTTLDPKKTQKVKKVVEYVFTPKDKQPKLISYDNSNLGWNDLQCVEIMANIGSYRYTINAANFSCTGGSGCNVDRLSLSILPKGKKESEQIDFVDYGLDGNLDYLGPRALLPFEKPVKLFGRTLPANTRYVPRDDRPRVDPQLDKKAIADSLYNTALNRIIAFYETKK